MNTPFSFDNPRTFICRLGYNTNSMLVTRSLTEMARFGKELGADPMTFLGLAGVGDLVVTCSTPLS